MINPKTSHTRADRPRPWRPSSRHLRIFLKILAIGGACCFGLFLTLVVIFWDADFYVARDRWETFKHAMFGEWEGHIGNPQRLVDQQADLHALIETHFSGYDSVHLFANKPVNELTLEVATGARFESVLDIVNGTPLHQWCDVSNYKDTVKHRIQLAEKFGSSKVVTDDLEAVSESQLAFLELDRSTLKGLSKTHCQFDFFIRDQPLTPNGEAS